MASSSPKSEITSSSSPIHHHPITIHDDDDDDNMSLFNIDVVLNLHYSYSCSYAGGIIITDTTHEKTKSFSFTLPLEVEDPQLINSDNIFDVLWDPTMVELHNLDVDHHLRPRIVDQIASAYLRDHRTRIVLDVPVVSKEEVRKPNKEVIQGLLVDSGMTTVGPTTSGGGGGGGGGGVITSCAICLEEAAAIDGDESVVGKLSCNHVYHVQCLVNWVLNGGTNANNPSCPLCRSPLFAAPT